MSSHMIHPYLAHSQSVEAYSTINTQKVPNILETSAQTLDRIRNQSYSSRMKQDKGKDGDKKPRKKKKSSIVIPQQITENESLELVASPIGPIRTIALSPIDAQIILDRLSKEIVEKFHFTLSPLSSSRNSDSDSANNGTGSRKRQRVVYGADDDVEEKKRQKTKILKSRLFVGGNSCTKKFKSLYSQRLQQQKEKQDHQQQLERSKAKSKNNQDDKDISFPNHMKQPESKNIITRTSICKDKPSLCILARDIRPPTLLAHIPYFCQQMDVPIILLPGNASRDLGSVLGGRITSMVLFTETEIDKDKISVAEKKLHAQINSYIEFAKLKIPTFPSNDTKG